MRKTTVEKYAGVQFTLWMINFVLCILMAYLLFTSKWIINNSWLSFAPSQGDTYWKGFIIECRTDYAVGGYSCDNYQFPWFVMDGVILSCRILYGTSWFLMIVALGVNVIIGNWNYVMAVELNLSMTTLAGVHNGVALVYFIIGCNLVVVTALVSKIVIRQHSGDSHVGPVNSYVYADTNYKHDVSYEFGMAYYWNLTLCGWIFIHTAIYFALNPYSDYRNNDNDDQSCNQLENYLPNESNYQFSKAPQSTRNERQYI